MQKNTNDQFLTRDLMILDKLSEADNNAAR